MASATPTNDRRHGPAGYPSRIRSTPTGMPEDPSYSPARLDLLNWLAAEGPRPVEEVAARLLGARPPADAPLEALVRTLPRVDVAGGMAAVAAPFWWARSWVLLDIETTGDRPDGSGGITEVAAWRVRGGEVLERFVTLINPGRPIPPSIQRLTGIHDRLVADAPSLDEVAPKLRAFLGNDPWMAHNLRFDCGHLESAFAARGLDPPPPMRICTLRWARRVILGGRHGLGALVERLRLGAVPTHRAEADVAATHRLALALFHQTPSLVRDFGSLCRWLAGGRIRPHVNTP